jgi:uncharacterized protein
MDPRLARGLEEFNAGNFFTAHEIWEELWNDCIGDEKRLVQALVQIAAGYAKVESGVRGGALKLLTRGLALLQTFAPTGLGLLLDAFGDGVAADIERLRRTAEASVSLRLVRPPPLRRQPPTGDA